MAVMAVVREGEGVSEGAPCSPGSTGQKTTTHKNTQTQKHMNKNTPKDAVSWNKRLPLFDEITEHMDAVIISRRGPLTEWHITVLCLARVEEMLKRARGR